jgi:prepilin-type processing-associated H-X9-DG protein
MDPSCTIAFHVKSRHEFDELIESCKDFIIPGVRHTDYPIFVFADGHSPNSGNSASSNSRKTSSSPMLTESLLRVRHRYIDRDGNVERETMSDDFVLIS